MTSPEQLSIENFAETELAAFMVFGSLTGAISNREDRKSALPDGGYEVTSQYNPISLGDAIVTLSQTLMRPAGTLHSVEGSGTSMIRPQLSVFDGQRTLVFRRPTVCQSFPHPERRFIDLSQVSAPFVTTLADAPPVSAGALARQQEYVGWLHKAEAHLR